MRRVLLCLAVFLLPSAAFAAEGVWVAQMEEDEGGPIMVASVDGKAEGDITPALRLMCAGDEGINLRYETAKDATEPGSEADFLFENESTQATKHMVFEDMDGAFAAYFPASDPIVSLLEHGADVFISESTGNYPAQSFPLKGSSKAIATMLKTCK